MSLASVLITLLAIGLPVIIFGWLILSGRRTSRIEREGLTGSAVVLHVFDNGLSRGAPIVRFHCSVTPDDTGQPFEGDTSPFVRRTTLASFYVGQTVRVRINQQKRSEFYIVGDPQIFYADAEHP